MQEKSPVVSFGPCFGECDLILLIDLFLPDSPIVTIQQCSTPVSEGDNATLYCNATGNPVPNTAWINAGKVVSYSKRHVIANISRDQAGSYECLAWNGIGDNGTMSCLIDVQCKLHYLFIGIVLISWLSVKVTSSSGYPIVSHSLDH